MAKLTITEALAEMPTIDKRIQKKQEFIMAYLYRQSAFRDPHEKDGGSAELINKERQSLKDLAERKVNIRIAIQLANLTNTITVEGVTMTIAKWLVWRKEIAPQIRNLYTAMVNSLNRMRQDAQRAGANVSDKDMGVTKDVVVHVNERELAESIERFETTLGALDGQLSLKNATIFIEVD